MIQQLEATSTVAAANWIIGGGSGTHHAAVSDGSDSTYIQAVAPGLQVNILGLGAFLNPGLPDYWPLQSVKAFMRYNNPGTGGSISVGVRLSGSNSFSAAQSNTSLTSFTSAALTRPGGGTWVIGDVPNIQLVHQANWSAGSGGLSVRAYVLIEFVIGNDSLVTLNVS